MSETASEGSLPIPEKINRERRDFLGGLVKVVGGLVGASVLKGEPPRRPRPVPEKKEGFPPNYFKYEPQPGEGVHPHIVRLEDEVHRETFSLSEEDFSREEEGRVPLPEKIAGRLRDELHTLNKLLPVDHRINRLELKKIGSSDTSDYYNVNRPNFDYTADPDRAIVYKLYPGHEYSYTRTRQTLFHEMMHLFADKEVGSGDEHAANYYLYLKSKTPPGITSQFNFTPEERKSLDLMKAGLFSLFAESSYRDEQGGHPDEKPPFELVASSFTVMRFFPRSLVASIQTLNDTDRAMTIRYMDHLLQTGEKIAKDREVFRGFFDKHLTDYISKEKARD